MATVDPLAVADAIAAIHQRIRDLAGDRLVRLVAVTKGFGSDAIRAAAAAGCSMVGESYAQELVAKVIELRDTDDVGGSDQVGDSGDVFSMPSIHFIGQLQTNKVRQLASVVDVWQTVDRMSLADEIARRAPAAMIMVQVNATAEADKGGCPPADVGALVAHCQAAGLLVDGLMTIGPTSQDRQDTVDAFTLVRGLVDDHGLTSCSMGMSGDMDLAIELGATHIRIGSAVFGERPHPRASIR